MKKIILLCLVVLLTACSGSKDNDNEIIEVSIAIKSNDVIYNNDETIFSATTNINVDEITFYFDGKNIGATISKPYSITYKPKDIAPGIHELTCIAKKDNKDYKNKKTITLYLRLGDDFRGGKIFYLDSTKEHGLISSTEDMVNVNDATDHGFVWGDNNDIITNLSDGYENTKKMASVAKSPGYAAYNFKNGYKHNGYDDWYIPSYNELKLLSENMNYVGNFNRTSISWEDYYWSSSQSTEEQAFCINFFALSGDNSYKYLSHKVRPIRKF